MIACIPTGGQCIVMAAAWIVAFVTCGACIRAIARCWSAWSNYWSGKPDDEIALEFEVASFLAESIVLLTR